MANGNQQRCCLLGVCCDPGGKAQREDLKNWLLEKLGNALTVDVKLTSGNTLEAEVECWLDELPWTEGAE